MHPQRALHTSMLTTASCNIQWVATVDPCIDLCMPTKGPHYHLVLPVGLRHRLNRQCNLEVTHLRAMQALTSALHPELVQGQLDLPCRTCDQILYFIGPQAAAILQQANVLLQRSDCVVRVGSRPACIPTCLSWVVTPVNSATEVATNEGNAAARVRHLPCFRHRSNKATSQHVLASVAATRRT